MRYDVSRAILLGLYIVYSIYYYYLYGVGTLAIQQANSYSINMCVYDKDDPPISLVFWPRASASQVVISIHLFSFCTL